MKVKCQECGKVFKSGSMSPKCPKCGSYDVDLAESRKLSEGYPTANDAAKSLGADSYVVSNEDNTVAVFDPSVGVWVWFALDVASGGWVQTGSTDSLGYGDPELDDIYFTTYLVESVGIPDPDIACVGYGREAVEESILEAREYSGFTPVDPDVACIRCGTPWEAGEQKFYVITGVIPNTYEHGPVCFYCKQDIPPPHERGEEYDPDTNLDRDFENRGAWMGYESRGLKSTGSVQESVGFSYLELAVKTRSAVGAIGRFFSSDSVSRVIATPEFLGWFQLTPTEYLCYFLFDSPTAASKAFKLISKPMGFNVTGEWFDISSIELRDGLYFDMGILSPGVSESVTSRSLLRERGKSQGYYLWSDAMNNKFMVRATVNGVGNELVGNFPDLETAREIALEYPDAVILNRVSNAQIPVREGDEGGLGSGITEGNHRRCEGCNRFMQVTEYADGITNRCSRCQEKALSKMESRGATAMKLTVRDLIEQVARGKNAQAAVAAYLNSLREEEVIPASADASFPTTGTKSKGEEGEAEDTAFTTPDPTVAGEEPGDAEKKAKSAPTDGGNLSFAEKYRKQAKSVLDKFLKEEDEEDELEEEDDEDKGDDKPDFLKKKDKEESRRRRLARKIREQDDEDEDDLEEEDDEEGEDKKEESRLRAKARKLREEDDEDDELEEEDDEELEEEDDEEIEEEDDDEELEEEDDEEIEEEDDDEEKDKKEESRRRLRRRMEALRRKSRKIREQDDEDEDDEEIEEEEDEKKDLRDKSGEAKEARRRRPFAVKEKVDAKDTADPQYQVGEDVTYSGSEGAYGDGKIIQQFPHGDGYLYAVAFGNGQSLVVPHEDLKRKGGLFGESKKVREGGK